MIRLFQATMRAIDDLPDWSNTPHVRIILKRGRLLVQGLFMLFLSKERVWLKSVSFTSTRKGVMVQRVPEKWAIFDQRAPRHQSRWFQSITVLGLVFLVIERVWQVWSYSKSWRIPNYQISNPTKTYFFIVWFSKNSRKRVSKSGILWPVIWAGVIKRFIWFFKNCAPRGTKVSFFKWFQNERECLSKWIYYQQ